MGDLGTNRRVVDPCLKLKSVSRNRASDMVVVIWNTEMIDWPGPFESLMTTAFVLKDV